MQLLLREPTLADEVTIRLAQRELENDGFVFAFGLTAETPWSDFLDRLRRLREGDDMPEGLVASTFLVAEVDGEIVGSTSLRFELNEYLATFGGHIGYCVRPAFRRRGYAAAMLGSMLSQAHARGIERVLVTCLDSNVASAGVIERQGGVFEGKVTREDGEIFRRYWFELGD
jgi:predicted acetyltransferase